MNTSYRILIFLFLLISVFSRAQQPAFLSIESERTDSILSTLSLEEKIAQLIMVTHEGQGEQSNSRKISQWIEKKQIGGVLFLRSTPFQLKKQIKRYQSIAALPLFMAIDAENGLSFRMDSVVHYPHAMALGATKNDLLIYQMGREVAQQCKALGINLNFAPVADVNSNPGNPIINYRSFGENPQKVAQKSWMLAKGMQDEHVFVTAKHFPGHGDTRYDSHLTLPVIQRDYAQLDSTDLYPFKMVIDSGIGGIMSAHISLPKIDKSGMPATLSKKIMTGILRDSLHFKGLVFSDAMNMAGIQKMFNENEAAVYALQAGVDVIEFVRDPGQIIAAVKKAIDNGELNEQIIEDKCRKVLLAKMWIHEPKGNKENNLNVAQYQLTSRYIHQQSITLLKNENNILPLKRLDTIRAAYLSIGRSDSTAFLQTLNKYIEFEHFHINSGKDEEHIDKIFKQLSNYNLIVAGIYGTTLSPRKKFGISEIHIKALQKLAQRKKVVLTAFANPYALKLLPNISKFEALLLCYGNNAVYEDLAAQGIFGALPIQGRLPVSVGSLFKEGDGIETTSSDRLAYTIPEETGFSSPKLRAVIDSFANYGIKEHIFPGCQILVAKHGKVIFHHSYGFHTYDSLTSLKNDHIYDWASLTKITGPLPLIMKLTENRILNLDVPFYHYWSDFNRKDKNDITLREILAHQAGLQPWVPFYMSTFKNNKDLKRRILRDRPSANFPSRISAGLYIHKNYKKKIYDIIAESNVNPKKEYKYSGLAFYLFPEMLSNITRAPYEQVLQEEFLRPLGAQSVHYNPYTLYQRKLFVPTEHDIYFRNETLQGFVHDEGAAMMGGISGNAGLFGTTNDLAKIMQFYLNEGFYGDFDYLRPGTLKEFTRVQYPTNENRRGLGFDKPYLDNAENKLDEAYPATLVSVGSFGHSGYTGTFAWADPENELLFIFMSNRVYPSRNNTRLFDLNFRPELQQAIYKCQKSFDYKSY